MIACAGYDPGFGIGGVAAVGREGNRLRLLHRAKIATNSKKTLEERVAIIFHAIAKPIREHRARLLVIEDQLGVSTAARMQQRKQADAIARGGKPGKALGFNSNNDKTIGVSWLAMGAALAYGCEIKTERPQTIKKAMAGFGGSNASKAQMIDIVKALFPELANENISEHEADAIACAVLGCRIIQMQLGTPIPEAISGQVTK